MKENWKPIEKSVNEKEVIARENLARSEDLDLPPELQSYITETIPDEVGLTAEETVLAELRIQNVRKAARAFRAFDKKIDSLKHAKLRFEEKFPINSAQNRPSQVILAMRKIDTEISEIENSTAELMQSNPEAYVVRNALELREYRKQLKSGDFVLTPYAERKIDELQDNYYAIDKIPFLNGETGSGKSSIAKYFCAEVLEVEPERIAGAKGIDETKIFGKIDLTSDENGPQARFVPGPLYRAMEKGVPLIIEEVNAIPPEILKSLNDIIINAKKGEEVSVIGDPKGSKVKAKDGFGVIMTGNLNRNPKAIDRYKGLFELSADFVNRVRPIDYDYLPQSTEGNYIEEAGKSNELYTLMIAMLMNDKGDVNAPKEAFDDLWRLAKFVRKVQEVYSGQRDGKLFSGQGGLNMPVTATSSVVSMRDVKQVIESWKRDNFEREFDYYVYKELIAPLTNAMDVKFFVQQLQSEGFLTDQSWKDVVSKAGTFDSAMHAPENKGQEIQFSTVRDVVQNVYGKIPERKEYPQYDPNVITYAKSELCTVQSQKEKMDAFLEGAENNQFRGIRDGLAELEADVTTLVKEMEDAHQTRDGKKLRILGEQLSESLTQLRAGSIEKVLKTVDSLQNRRIIKAGEFVDLWKERIKKEETLWSELKDVYTEDYIAASNRIEEYETKRNPDQILGKKELIVELEGLLEEKNELVKNFHSDLTLADRVNEIINRILDLELRLGADMYTLEDVKHPASVLMSDFNFFFRKHNDLRWTLRTDVYPNLDEKSEIIELDQIPAIFNPHFRDEKGLAYYRKELLEKTIIHKDAGVEEVFANARRVFKEESAVTFQLFFQKDFFDTRDENGNPNPKSFEIDTKKINTLLSGFSKSDTWMVEGFIYHSEKLYEYSEDYAKAYMYSFPAVFCVAQKNGEDVLLALDRTGDHEWSITKVTQPSISAQQFVAPTITGKAFN
ncbi:AAA family ATPase [Candidatus Kaiserbacteria bacterium]|nr:MAG: AAA family ATPase [Candidatus Kaiserbacteria bacterium]